MNEKNMPCAYWAEGDVCLKNTEPGYTEYCVLGPCSEMQPSNGDKFRQMSDEELAKKLSGIEGFALTCGSCWSWENWLDWLKREAKDE